MTKLRTLHILLTGGGSGGHVYPLIAVAKELERLSIENRLALELHYLGPRDDFALAIQKTGVHMHALIAGKLRRYASPRILMDMLKIMVSLPQAFWRVFWLMPDAIFSKGGPGALPVVLAGWFYRIPIIIHESDTIPGLTNALSGRLATRVAVSFESAGKYFNPRIVSWTGAPIRQELLTNRLKSADAKERLGFNINEPLVLVLGGSQGSRRINEFIVENLAGLLPYAQVFHQTGMANLTDTEKLSQVVLRDIPPALEAKHRYKAVAYLNEDVGPALSAADLLVCRAGSGTIFEVAAFGKPAICIPLPESANNHQRANAYEFARAGAAVVIEENNLLSGIFLRQVKEILTRPQKLQAISAAAARFFKPGAATTIAEEILRVAL